MGIWENRFRPGSPEKNLKILKKIAGRNDEETFLRRSVRFFLNYLKFKLSKISIKTASQFYETLEISVKTPTEYCYRFVCIPQFYETSEIFFVSNKNL